MWAAERRPGEADRGAVSRGRPALTALPPSLQTPPLGTGSPPLSLQPFTLPPQKRPWSQHSGQVHPCFLFSAGSLNLFLGSGLSRA